VPLDVYDIKPFFGNVNKRNTNKIHFFIFFLSFFIFIRG